MQEKLETMVETTDSVRASAKTGLMGLFLNELKDIYWAEKALVKAFPKMVKNATSSELVATIEDHLSVTETHVERLEKVFKSIGKKPEAKKCEAMAGLLKEAELTMEETETGLVRDAGIISAAQKVEHYEIASYGTLVSLANTLGELEVAKLLGLTLDEEKEADQAFTEIAEYSIDLDVSNEE